MLVAFTEEEGARFGVAYLGSRLLTGVVDPQAARDLTAALTLTAMASAGLDPAPIGPTPALVDGLSRLHRRASSRAAPWRRWVRRSASPTSPVAPELVRKADHAGTARFADRRDPMLTYAGTVLAARQVAAERGALVTFGKVIAEPNGANGVSSAVRAWLDARAADEATLSDPVTDVRSAAEKCAAEQRVTLTRWSPHPRGPLRRGPARPDREGPRRGRNAGPGAADGRATSARRARGPAAHRHALRP